MVFHLLLKVCSIIQYGKVNINAIWLLFSVSVEMSEALEIMKIDSSVFFHAVLKI